MIKKLSYIIALIVLLPSIGYAVTAVDFYGNTDCANNGDGTSSSCAGSPGGAGAANSLSNAISRAKTAYSNMVTSDVAITIHMKGAAADTSCPNPDWGATATSTTQYLTITVDSGDRGTIGIWDTGKYRLDGTCLWGQILVSMVHTKISWLQIGQGSTSASDEHDGILLDAPSGGTSPFLYIENCLIRFTGNTANSSIGIMDFLSGATGMKKVVRNNIIYGFKQGTKLATAASDNVYVYNNTFYSNVGTSTIFSAQLCGSGATYTAKNNIVNGSGTAYETNCSNATYTHSNNISHDATSPDTSYRSLSVTFNNAGSNDYHLGASDTAAAEAGADLSAATEGFSTDIDGDSRPQSTNWDIGADERVGGGGGGGGAVVSTLMVDGEF